MGKKGKWFTAVKRAFGSESKEKKEQRRNKNKFGKQKQEDLSSLTVENEPTPPPPSPPPQEEIKVLEIEDEQATNAHKLALASAAAAEAAVAAAQAAAEVVRLTSAAASRESGRLNKDAAATKIQTAFRCYLARRTLRALRGLARLKTLMDGQSVKRQATTTLRCMQTLARVQSQIRARRIRMSEENQALQKQLQQKHEKELETMKASMGDDWDVSAQSKEQLEAKQIHKQEAAMRRERALAYAFSHQQTLRNSGKAGNPTFMDPNNPHWGWSWLERWMAARPWECRSLAENKEPNSDQGSVKSVSRAPGAADISKVLARRDPDKASPTAQKLNGISNRNSVSTPPSKATSPVSVARKLKPASPRSNGAWTPDEDSRSVASVQSDKPRRNSVAGSSVRDDEGLASPPAFLPSYMAPTASAKARTRLQSPLGIEKSETATPERGPVESAKKRLSFSGSPKSAVGQQRRYSGPPKVDNSPPMKDIAVHTEQLSVGSGGKSNR
ncbi:hypothetical protein C5167_046524 [Papaver somniferum]|uniref:DUF4005 domain-containing protein n=1 Tax=Papaver somniferum TaxID=3469 RepID=A0A4Y7LGR3_PAPSO|nr:protein IQ-DOMAIN 1-like [Papaver somniferum]RZC83738.1 hypothetical protein C5167_046524 [Papaver somniferum]